MAERVLYYDVDFSNSSLGVYADPVKGAALLLHGDMKAVITTEEVQQCCDLLDKHFSYHSAPPFRDRPFNIQEGETILCKYKAYYKGQYYVGKDIKEVGEGLEAAYEGGCDLAQHLFKCMPPLYDDAPSPYGQELDGLHECVWGLDYPIACLDAGVV